MAHTAGQPFQRDAQRTGRQDVKTRLEKKHTKGLQNCVWFMDGDFSLGAGEGACGVRSPEEN